jgi:hypothetical protein
MGLQLQVKQPRIGTFHGEHFQTVTWKMQGAISEIEGGHPIPYLDHIVNLRSSNGSWPALRDLEHPGDIHEKPVEGNRLGTLG